MRGRAIIAGAKGLVGRALVRQLAQFADLELVELGRAAGDLRDSRTWQGLPRADIVFQLAARAFVPESWQRPQEFLSDNLAIANNAADYCRVTNARIVQVSSYLYGNPDALPVAETAPIKLLNPYALSKKVTEDIVVHLAEMFGFPAVIVRPFNIYGPGQDERFLLPSILRQAQENRSIRVMDMKPRRDYIHVDDVADLLIAAGRSGESGDIFNAGSGESHSVGEVIDIVSDLLGREVEVICEEETRPAEIMDTRADITRAQQQLGWTPRIPLREGLASLMDGRDEAGGRKT